MREKLAADKETPTFRNLVKTMIREAMDSFQLGVTNVPQQMMNIIAKWGRNLVEDEIGQICTANADVIVAALKAQLLSVSTEPGEIRDQGIPGAVKQALVRALKFPKIKVQF